MADQIKIEGRILVAEGALEGFNLQHLLSLLADKLRDGVAEVSAETDLPNGEMSLTLTAVPVQEAMGSSPYDTKTLSRETTLLSHFLTIKT